jgi:hypothetical protein
MPARQESYWLFRMLDELLETTGDDLPLYLSDPEAFLPSFSHAAGLIVFQSFSVKLRVRSVK